MSSGHSPRAIREQLRHPIIDCDGHWLESHAMLAEYIGDIGGDKLAQAYIDTRKTEVSPKWYTASNEERMKQRMRRRAWWHFPANAKQQAIFRLPKFFNENMDEMGISNRRKLSFAGHVSVNVVLDGRYDFLGDPDVVPFGLPEFDDEGESDA